MGEVVEKVKYVSVLRPTALQRSAMQPFGPSKAPCSGREAFRESLMVNGTTRLSDIIRVATHYMKSGRIIPRIVLQHCLPTLLHRLAGSGRGRPKAP